jgi:hypothetical protein
MPLSFMELFVLDDPRTRKLHHFFGETFDIERIGILKDHNNLLTFSTDKNQPERASQPDFVRVHKLNRFFGTRVEVEKKRADDEAEEDEEPEVDTKIRSDFKAKRIFGEHIDIEKERSTFRFAEQPGNVSEPRLKKIFGESPPIRASTLRTRDKVSNFFGEDVEINRASRSMTFSPQPSHVLKYKLNRKFGEPVVIGGRGVVGKPLSLEEDLVLDESYEDYEEETEEERITRKNKKNRKLHVFFGQKFDVEEISYEERLLPSTTHQLLPKLEDRTITGHLSMQPSNVRLHKLSKFFGQRLEAPKSKKDSNELVDIPPNPEGNLFKAKKMLGEATLDIKEASKRLTSAN